MTECGYSHEYNVDKDEKVLYKCPRKSVDGIKGARCEFHNKIYADDKNNHSSIMNNLRSLIKNNSDPSLECIGFYIPETLDIPEILGDINTEERMDDEKNGKKKIEFSKPVYFSFAKFNGKANFRDVIFHGNAGFSYTKFNKEAIFSNAQFEREAGFSNAVFSNKAYFNGKSKRERNASTRMKFKGYVNFFNATFKDKVDFSGCKLEGCEGYPDSKASFTHINFEGDVLFSCAMYSSSIFPPNDEKKEDMKSDEKKDTEHERDILLYRMIKGKKSPIIKFDDTVFLGKARFGGDVTTPLQLGLVSFKGVDLTNITFGSVQWLKKGRFWRRNAIVDEFIRNENDKKEFLAKETKSTRGINAGFFDEISGIYNQLRKNYEARLSFREASDFYIGDMEMTRRKLSEHSHNAGEKFTGIVYGMHKYLNLYGESTFIPLAIWSPIFIALFALIRFYEGDWDVNTLGQNFIESLFAYFQFPLPTDNSDWVSVERIVSAPILAIAIKSFALTKRFETAIR